MLLPPPADRLRGRRRSAGERVGDVGESGGRRRRAACWWSNGPRGRGADSAGRRDLRGDRRRGQADHGRAAGGVAGLNEKSADDSRRARTRLNMKFDIVTIFPRMIEAGLAEGVVEPGSRARVAGRADSRPARLHDRPAPQRGRCAVWRRTGDGDEARAAGAGGRARFARRAGRRTRWCLLVAAGPAVHAGEAERLGRLGHVVLLCGRYEGMDERVRELVATEETVDRRLRAERRRAGGARRRRCGEPAGAGCGRRRAVGRARIRSRADCSTIRTTRGRQRFAGRRVPDVLLSGHHADVRRWRRKAALARTLERRPELIATACSTKKSGRCSTRLRRNGPNDEEH